MEPYRKDDNPRNLTFFTILIVLTQVLGLTAVILVAVWMGHFLGGFAWTEDPAKQFNYHPVFMVIGMVFLYADAILAYRVFRNMKKLYIKIIHASIQAGALIFTGVGLKAVFDFHNAAGIPNLYTLHSWIGLLTVILFGLQWVFGFTAYLFPKLSFSIRSMYMSHHVFWGLAIFGLACAAALTGILEKALFLMLASNDADKLNYKELPSQALVINCLGMTIIALGISVAYVVTRPEYKRPTSPEEEEHIQLNPN